MQKIIPLEYGKTYHIYNRGINSVDIFTCEKNYERFLSLYNKYINPIADTFAWVLLRNHFHLLIRIKGEGEIPYIPMKGGGDLPNINDLPLSGTSPLTGGGGRVGKKYNPTKQFSHLFNAYAQYFNKFTGRHGGLFETPFRRIRVDSKDYFRQLVYYIHYNPVKHGFAKSIRGWGWSSFLSIISIKPTKLCRDTVVGYFDDTANFINYHKKEDNLRGIDLFGLE